MLTTYLNPVPQSICADVLPLFHASIAGTRRSGYTVRNTNDEFKTVQSQIELYTLLGKSVDFEWTEMSRLYGATTTQNIRNVLTLHTT
jgi:hypothetical protein